jgi:hypothetical protein
MARPWLPPEGTFDNYALRGPLVAVRGLAAFAIALFAGAWLGRILPGLIAAAAMCAAVVLALTLLWPFGQPRELPRVPATPENGAVAQPGLAVPGERLGEVEAREAVFLGGVVLLFVAATIVTVERRRPY